jgi:hypothetical protein
MTMTLEFEFDDSTFEVEVITFSAGKAARRWDEEPEPGEIDLDNTVVVVPDTDAPYSERPRSKISMDDFLVRYAGWKDVPVIEAWDVLLAECFKLATDRVESDYDDRGV